MEYDNQTYPYIHLRLGAADEPFLTKEEIEVNQSVIDRDVTHLVDVFGKRIAEHSGAPSVTVFDDFHPIGESDQGPYAELVRSMQLEKTDRALLALTLLIYYSPLRLTRAIDTVRKGTFISMPEIGGYFLEETKTFVPTLETLAFILYGNNETDRLYEFVKYIIKGKLFREQIIRLGASETNRRSFSDFNSVPVLATEYIHHLLYGREVRPDFGDDFPARKINCDIDVKRQLILPVHTAREVGLLQHAIHSVEESLKQGKKVKGMPALFFGPPGTGKTLTATALGQLTGRPVFKIDLAQVVSKYVGETEKRLANVFDRADGKNWILFFDEADSLFAKRTGVGDAHDRYANLLTAYLLQRMEDYAGISILSTNYRQNLDQAMTRRFVQIIRFPEPQHKERDQIWQTALPEGFEYEAGMSTKVLAQAELTGANIAMILKLCMLHAVSRKTTTITANDIKYWSIQEFAKSGISPKMRSWPNEKLRGFTKAKPLTDPLYPEQVLHVAEYENFANINLFEE
ncbi:MAG: AAA ATPase [Bacteroidetes bacterium]|nr:MAG: AAA ATPase [Bacteroidota bacterium]